MTTTERGAVSEIVSVADARWEDRAPGIRVKPLWSHAETSRRLLLARFDPGVEVLHRHVGDEITFVLEGAVSDEWGTMTTGDLAHHPKGCVHTERSEHGVLYLALVTGATERTGRPGDGPRSAIVRPHDVPWLDARPGMRVKRLWADSSGSPRAGFMRFEPGASFALHRHDGEEIIFVLDGSVSDEDGTVAAGDVAHRPDGCVHTVTSRKGATLLVFAWGGVEMIDADEAGR